MPSRVGIMERIVCKVGLEMSTVSDGCHLVPSPHPTDNFFA
jgi:hypothetical protein